MLARHEGARVDSIRSRAQVELLVDEGISPDEWQ
jgi:hypothetical protein